MSRAWSKERSGAVKVQPSCGGGNGRPVACRMETFCKLTCRVVGCAASGPGRTETWINHAIEGLYVELHELGFAHSVECWKDGVLAGGLATTSMALGPG